MKYCRHCGKLIDIDSIFCTHCGKNQDIQGDSTYIGSIRKAFAKYIEIIISFIQSFLVKQKTSYINYNSKTWENIKNWGKHMKRLWLIASLIVITCVFLMSCNEIKISDNNYSEYDGVYMTMESVSYYDDHKVINVIYHTENLR